MASVRWRTYIEITSLLARSLLEELRAMFASVQNWLALQFMLFNVLHCRSVMPLQVTRLGQGLSVRVGC